MLAPNPRGWTKEEYGERFREYFAQADKRLKAWHVIQFRQYGFSAADIKVMTGYAMDTILDVERRFAARCAIRLIKEIQNVPTQRKRSHRKSQHRTNR